MTREEREAAIAYIKGYRKLDEDLHNTAPKDSISYYATDKCLKYWDMAIKALSQEPCEDAISRADAIDQMEQSYNILDATDRIKALPPVTPIENEIENEILILQAYKRGYDDALSTKDHEKPQEPCEDAVSREAAIEVIYGNEYKKDMRHALEQLPSVQPIIIHRDRTVQDFVDKCRECGRIRKGHWIDYSDEGYVECPYCEHATTCEDNIDELHYCFWCGAEMVKESSDADSN